MIDLSKTMNFHSADWIRLKTYLTEMHSTKIRQLVGSSDHDQSNVLRGELRFIERLLAAEEAAKKAATQGQPQ